MNFNKVLYLFLMTGCIFAGCQSDSDSETKQKQQEAAEHAFRSTSVEFTDQWAQAAQKDGNSAVYLQIYNGTATADTLVAVHSAVAGEAALHESFQEKGLTGMRPADRLVISPKSILALQPGGLHIMLMNTKQRLAEGDSIQVVIELARTGKKEVTVPVRLAN